MWRSALARACLDSALCDAALVPSRFRACKLARDRAGFALRAVTFGAFFPGGGGSLTPARLAFDSPMAITCLADRAPCSPARTCSISSRTYSPACVEGAVFFCGIAIGRLRPGTFLSPALPSTEPCRSAGRPPVPNSCRSCQANCLYRNPVRSPGCLCRCSG